MPESWNTVIVPSVNRVGPLRLNASKLNRTYGVSLVIGADDQLQNFHYEIQLSYTPLNDQQYVVEINKERVYVNDKPAEQMVDEFAEKCGNTLYPLKVLTDVNGKFIKIVNYNQLQERWHNNRKKLQEYYTGNVVDNLLAAMDKAMSNELHVNKVIKSDWFFSLYFTPLYTINNKPDGNEGELKLPLIAYTAPLKFNISQSIDATPTESKTFEVKQLGTCSDSRSAEDLLKGLSAPLSGVLHDVHTAVKGTAELKYKLYLNDHTISSMVARSTVLIGTQERTADIQVYHLREKDSVAISKPSVMVDEPVKEPEKKKGFFSFLFN
jgi:hypothetical protein